MRAEVYFASVLNAKTPSAARHRYSFETGPHLLYRLTYPLGKPKIPGKCGLLPAWPQRKPRRMDSERRHAPRYPFIAEAEVTEISSDTKLVAKTSDVSIRGCFLDMLNPSPQGTDVRVTVSHKGATFTALGSVVFVLPNMGMGVVFTSIDPDQQPILQRWIATVNCAE
jgi:hypothetical protein